MNKQEEEKKVISPINTKWTKVLKFLNNTLNMKNSIANWFVFRPPSHKTKEEKVNGKKQKSYTYQFWQRTKTDEFEFVPHDFINLNLYVLRTNQYIVKNSQEFLIPLIHVINTKKKALKDYIIIYSHGNASDLGDAAPFTQNLSIVYQVDFILYDYRGYGISKDSKISEQSLYDDLEVVLGFVHNKIILWGFSMGTCATIDIAARYSNLGGVLLQSPLASVLTWLNKETVWNQKYEKADIFANLQKIQYIQSKIFLIHGKRDEIINVRHAYLLYDRYLKSSPRNNQIWMVIAKDVGHNDIQQLLDDPKSEFTKRVRKFFATIKISQSDKMKKYEDDIDRERARFKEEFRAREEKALEVLASHINVNDVLFKNMEQIKKVKSYTQESEIQIIEEMPQNNQKQFQDSFLTVVQKKNNEYKAVQPMEEFQSVVDALQKHLPDTAEPMLQQDTEQNDQAPEDMILDKTMDRIEKNDIKDEGSDNEEVFV